MLLFSTVACSNPTTISKDQTFEMPEDPIPIVFRTLQMQPQEVFYKKSFSAKFRNINRKTCFGDSF